MANRTEPLTPEEAKKRRIVCSDEDAEVYGEILKTIRTHDVMKYGDNVHSLDEGRREKNRDLSWNAARLPEIDGHFVGPYALGGNAAVHLLMQTPEGYIRSKYPRMSRARAEREHAKLGYEGVVKKYGASLKNRTWAVKKLLEKKRLDGIPAQRFIRESKISEGYDHPHFPHAIYTDHDDYTIVSRMFFGTPLSQIGNTRNLREKFHLGVHLWKNLMDFYKAGILHRDINGNNIIDDGESLVTHFIDFGLSSVRKVEELTWEHMREQEGITVAEFVEGTLAGAAPEVLLHTLKAHTVESDIFSAAAMVYSLMTGRNYLELTEEERKEVEGVKMGLEIKTLAKVNQWVQGKSDFRIIPIREVNPGIPDFGLDEFLLQCMSPHPEDRPSSFKKGYRILRKMEKSLDSKAMRDTVACFQLPLLTERTAMIKESVVREAERRSAEAVKAEENKIQTLKLERKNMVTSTEQYQAQGIEVLRTSSKDLQAEIDGLDIFQDENDIFAGVEHLVTGDPSDTRIGEAIKKKQSERIMVTPEDQPDDSEQTIIIPADQNSINEDAFENGYDQEIFPEPSRLPDYQPKTGRFSINCKPYQSGKKRLARLTIRSKK